MWVNVEMGGRVQHATKQITGRRPPRGEEQSQPIMEIQISKDITTRRVEITNSLQVLPVLLHKRLVNLHFGRSESRSGNELEGVVAYK